MKLLRLIAGATLVSACATAPETPPASPTAPAPSYSEPVPRHEPLSAYGNHSPYIVANRTYRVLPTSEGYVEEGLASWYGVPFHGRRTSNQEIYDMHQFTAAHKTLPLPTYAEVTNLENGRSVIVRINDRGPFKSKRIIDLSKAAAEKLGMIEQGIAKVRVRALIPEGAAARPAVETAEAIYLQLGAFGSEDNALALIGRLRGQIDPHPHITTIATDSASLHRVRIGPLASTAQASRLSEEVIALGFPAPKIVFE